MYSNDTLSVDKLIERERLHLLTLFSERDLEFMKFIGNRSTLWSDNNIEVPLVIYSDKNKIYWDNRRSKYLLQTLVVDNFQSAKTKDRKV